MSRLNAEMEKHGYYQYKIWLDMFMDKGRKVQHWVYEIYDLNNPPELVRESTEWFDSEARAEFAAIGHISLLENGEG